MDFEIIVWGVVKGHCAERVQAEEFAMKVADEEREPAIVRCDGKILSECYDGKCLRFDEDADDYATECLEELNEEEFDEDDFDGCDDDVSEIGYNPYTGGWDADL